MNNNPARPPQPQCYGGGDGDGDGGGDARLPVLMVVQGFPPLAVSNLKWVIRCWRRTSLPSGTTPPGTEQ